MKSVVINWFLMFIPCIYLVSGMDNSSNTPESSNEEKINIEVYAKQKQNFDGIYSNKIVIPYNQKYYINEFVFKENETEKNSDVKTLSEEYEEKFFNNIKLKRKHKPDKILVCEFCLRECNRFQTGKFSGKYLCKACYMIEYRHGYLVPLNERKKTTKYNNPLLVCEFCQGESTRYKTGKVSGKSLCISCYNYEYFHGHLVPLDERKYYGKHKDNVLVCEFCQNESIQYKKSQVTGKSLCQACYQYEYKNDCLVPLNERKQFQKHKDYIIACEICQKENTSYITGKVTGKSLCKKCYMIEYQQSHMLDLDGKHSNILVCDFCQNESIQYKESKISDKSLCEPCYQYEYRYGYIIPLDERKKCEKHKDHILACEVCQKDKTRYMRGKISGKALCKACYMVEYRQSFLLSLEEKNDLVFFQRNNQTNHLIDTVKQSDKNKGKIEEKVVSTKLVTEKQDKYAHINIIVQKEKNDN